MFSPPIKVIIVDDHPVALQGLRGLLNDREGIEIIAEALSGEQLIEILRKGTIPDVILLDISLPGMNGVASMQNIKKSYDNVKVIFFSIYTGDEFVAKCIIHGGDGYLPKASSGDEIAEAIYRVHRYGLSIDDRLVKVIRRLRQEMTSQNQNELTKKEEEILILICQGYLTKEIADKLNKSIKTVDYHKKHIMLKTNCKNDAQLGVYAREKGLISETNKTPLH